MEKQFNTSNFITIVEDGNLDNDAEGENDSEFTEENIIGYDKKTDSILFASGEVIQNNNQIPEEDIKRLIMRTQHKRSR